MRKRITARSLLQLEMVFAYIYIYICIRSSKIPQIQDPNSKSKSEKFAVRIGEILDFGCWFWILDLAGGGQGDHQAIQ